MKLVLFIFTGLFLVTHVYGQDHPKTLLWKVAKKGSANESYLFGTFHEVSPAFFNSLSNAVGKLHGSEILFVEQNTPPAEQPVLQEVPTWDREKWQSILTSEQRSIFQEFVEKIADTTCYSQSPFELLLGITRNYMLTFCETDTDYTGLMDSYIENIALKAKKQVRPLDISHNLLITNLSEKFSRQQDSLNIANCILGMKSTLDGDLSGCKAVTAYRNFDIDYKLDTLLEQNSAAAALLVDRNSNWKIILDKAFSFHNCFVAVGFNHLRYKQGLIQQLREIGYEVTPIPTRL